MPRAPPERGGVVPLVREPPERPANKPGDVIRARAGKTVEIINTDAEGRLILADALDYARPLPPAAMVDCATLTGACVIALGNHAAALLGTDEELVGELRDGRGPPGERCWPLPLWERLPEAAREPGGGPEERGGAPRGDDHRRPGSSRSSWGTPPGPTWTSPGRPTASPGRPGTGRGGSGSRPGSSWSGSGGGRVSRAGRSADPLAALLLLLVVLGAPMGTWPPGLAAEAPSGRFPRILFVIPLPPTPIRRRPARGHDPSRPPWPTRSPPPAGPAGPPPEPPPGRTPPAPGVERGVWEWDRRRSWPTLADAP
jgi:hypothetical protein